MIAKRVTNPGKSDLQQERKLESFRDRSHLNVILNEAQQIVNNALS
jgi:hypothetical protein